MFSKYQDDKVKEWNNLIERYISLHKYIKDVGKIGITQGRSGHIDKEVQTKIKDALVQTNKTLHQLKNFFKPCLTEVDTSDVFPEEKSKAEIENLNKKVSELTQENNSLQQKLLSEPGNYKSLHLETECQLLLEDKKELHEQINQLERHCRFLTEQIEVLISKKVSGEEEDKNTKPSKEIGVPIFYLKRQEQLEGNLKAQNDLIFDLKRQLTDTIREKEMFKSLNKDLEVEVQKRSHFNFENGKKNEEENISKSDVAYDYSNRSTLRIDESVNAENKKLDFVPDLNKLEEMQKLNENITKMTISMEPHESLTKHNNDTMDKHLKEQNVHKLEQAMETNNNGKEDDYKITQGEGNAGYEEIKHDNESNLVLY
ncbi:hypothetical protein ILUMI_27382 [Ignelater luminosus]|uniref:Uncharacterized protein n=1 Tax=Ignelater luminosus TaxID=2038154 RepID=A0A8K0C3H6_IGNLU|nr:hypothetical protein ILUMI_27382 [Ignelater luminosus]